MSLDRELRAFIENLIEAIGYLGIEEIPFGSQQFEGGIQNLKAVFENVAPDDYRILEPAFVRDIITGSYSKIEQEICSSPSVSVNASSFDKVSLAPYTAEKPTQLFEILAQSFCKGAGLQK
jgi:hypothetical protein